MVTLPIETRTRRVQIIDVAGLSAPSRPLPAACEARVDPKAVALPERSLWGQIGHIWEAAPDVRRAVWACVAVAVILGGLAVGLVSA